MSAAHLCGQLDSAHVQLLLSAAGLSLHGSRAALEERLAREMQRRTCGVWVWETLPSLPVARIGCSIVEHDFSLYVFGGFHANGALTNSLLEWTPGSQKWEEVSVQGSVRAPRLNSHLAVVYNEELWIFGAIRSLRLGIRDLCIAVFNFARSEWRHVEVQQPPARGINEFSMYSHCLYEDTLLVAMEDGVYGYDFATRTWKAIYHERGVRTFHGQYHMTLHESELWLFGWHEDSYSDVDPSAPAFEPVIAKINLQTRIWSRVLSSSVAPRLRERCQAVRVDDKWVLHGGSTFSASGTSLSDSFVFNMTSRTWSKIENAARHGVPRAHYGACSYRDKAIIFCGGRSNWLGRTGTLSTPCYEVEALRLLTNAELDLPRAPQTFIVYAEERRCVPLRPVRRELFDEPRMSDVCVCVQGRQFYAHQLVLAETSAVFEKMVTSDLVEKNRKEIVMKNIDAKVVEILLRYAYGCLDEVPQERILDVFRAADLYEVVGLRGLCLKRMAEDICLENLFDYWALAEYYSSEELLAECVEYGRNHAARIVASSELSAFRRLKPIATYRFLRQLGRAVRGQYVFDPRRYSSWGLEITDAVENLDLCQFSSTVLGKIEILKQAITLLSSDTL